MTEQRDLWDWLKAETRHLAVKPALEVDDKGKPLEWFPDNRAALRNRRFSRTLEKPGRSRRRRVSRAQHRIDVREHERKWRQEKRRARRADPRLAAAIGIETTESPWVELADPADHDLTSVPA